MLWLDFVVPGAGIEPARPLGSPGILRGISGGYWGQPETANMRFCWGVRVVEATADHPRQ